MNYIYKNHQKVSSYGWVVIQMEPENDMHYECSQEEAGESFLGLSNFLGINGPMFKFLIYSSILQWGELKLAVFLLGATGN